VFKSLKAYYKGDARTYDEAFTSKCNSLLSFVQKLLESERPGVAQQVAYQLHMLVSYGKNTEYPSLQFHILNKMGLCEKSLGMFQSALDILSSALELGRECEFSCSETLVNMSAVYIDTKNYKKAQNLAREAITEITRDMDSNSSLQLTRLAAVAYFNAGTCDEKLKNTREAIDSYQAGMKGLKKAGVPAEDGLYKSLSIGYMRSLRSFKNETNDLNLSEGNLAVKTRPSSAVGQHSNLAKSILIKGAVGKQTNKTKNLDLGISFPTTHEDYKPYLRNENPSGMSSSKNRYSIDYRIKKNSDLSRGSIKPHTRPSANAPPSSSENQDQSWDEYPQVDISIHSQDLNPEAQRKARIEDIMRANKAKLAVDLKELNERLTQSPYSNNGIKAHQTDPVRKPEERNIGYQDYSDTNQTLSHEHNREDSGKHSQDILSDKRSSLSQQKEAADQVHTPNSFNFKKDKNKTIHIKKSNQKPQPSSHGKQTQNPYYVKSSNHKQNKANNRITFEEDNKQSSAPPTVSKQDREEKARLIQKHWKRYKLSDSHHKKQTQKIYRAARFLCNQYWLLRKDLSKNKQGQSLVPEKVPVKAMIFLNRDMYLIHAIQLNTSKTNYLEIQKSFNVLADQSRIVVNEKNNVTFCALAIVPLVQEEPRLIPLKKNLEDSRRDSLDQIKEEIINGILEPDNTRQAEEEDSHNPALLRDKEELERLRKAKEEIQKEREQMDRLLQQREREEKERNLKEQLELEKMRKEKEELKQLLKQKELKELQDKAERDRLERQLKEKIEKEEREAAEREANLKKEAEARLQKAKDEKRRLEIEEIERAAQEIEEEARRNREKLERKKREDEDKRLRLLEEEKQQQQKAEEERLQRELEAKRQEELALQLKKEKEQEELRQKQLMQQKEAEEKTRVEKEEKEETERKEKEAKARMAEQEFESLLETLRREVQKATSGSSAKDLETVNSTRTQQNQSEFVLAVFEREGVESLIVGAISCDELRQVMKPLTVVGEDYRIFNADPQSLLEEVKVENKAVVMKNPILKDLSVIREDEVEQMLVSTHRINRRLQLTQKKTRRKTPKSPCRTTETKICSPRTEKNRASRRTSSPRSSRRSSSPRTAE